jgi:hypothetical protein
MNHRVCEGIALLMAAAKITGTDGKCRRVDFGPGSGLAARANEPALLDLRNKIGGASEVGEEDVMAVSAVAMV